MVKEKRQRIDNMYCYSGRINENFSSMIILPRHFAPFFSAWNLYMFDRSLSGFPRVALEFFKWHPPPSARGNGGLPRRWIDEPRIRLHVWRENPRLISTRQKIWQWRKLLPPTEFHDSFSSLNSPANRNRCLPFICTRRPRTLFPASFNSLNSFDCISIKIITLISWWKLNLCGFFSFFFFFEILYAMKFSGGMTFKETKQNRNARVFFFIWIFWVLTMLKLIIPRYIHTPRCTKGANFDF